MPAPMVTPPTGVSLQRLTEQSWDRLAAGSVLHYEGSQWTGEELAERVRRVSGGLQEAGLGPGERVVTCMANCPEVSITYSAIWRTVVRSAAAASTFGRNSGVVTTRAAPLSVST